MLFLGRTSPWGSDLSFLASLSSGHYLEIEGNHAGPDVLLEALPVSPGAAVKTKGPLHGGDDGFYAGPEVAQLLVYIRALDHIQDVQVAFLGKADILDPCFFGFV